MFAEWMDFILTLLWIVYLWVCRNVCKCKKEQVITLYIGFVFTLLSSHLTVHKTPLSSALCKLMQQVIW